MLDITVTDPETHKGGTVSFVDFKVTITTDDPRFQLRNFFVRRRYSDFKWLRGQLTLNELCAVAAARDDATRSSGAALGGRQDGARKPKPGVELWPLLWRSGIS